MKLKLLLLLACTVSFASLSLSHITGMVLDDINAPLPGANVQEKGTTNGVVTDFDGNFIINVQDSNTILVISYIGFETKELTLDGSLNYTIQLATSSTGLDEVVVIGYGSVKKSDLTGAVASLSNETVTEQRKTDIGQAIQGRVAGVDVRTLNSKPGAPLSIQIRGNTVITANQGSERDGVSDDISTDPDQPLYVVDGVFFDNINVLNPADIEQIDILKDVSATAIYGARGANGVVIITTKNGIEGVSRFTYDATFGLRSATNLPDFFTGPEYVGFVDDVLRAREWLGTDLSIDAYNNVAIDRSTEFQTSNEEASNVANGRYTDWADFVFEADNYLSFLFYLRKNPTINYYNSNTGNIISLRNGLQDDIFLGALDLTPRGTLEDGSFIYKIAPQRIHKIYTEIKNDYSDDELKSHYPLFYEILTSTEQLSNPVIVFGKFKG